MVDPRVPAQTSGSTADYRFPDWRKGMDFPTMGPTSAFLRRVHADAEDFYDGSETFRGKKTVVRAKDGWFGGPRIKGEILLGTGDRFIVRPVGVAEGDVRDTYRTHDGHVMVAVTIGKQEGVGVTCGVHRIL